MIVIASCGHNCDDERVYYKQIKTLSSNQYQIQYYTYCYENYLADELDNSIEYNFFSASEISQKQYKKLLFNRLNGIPPKVLHIHDMELLSVAYELKNNHPDIKIIYDVHEDLEAMWDTFSSYSGIIKKMINWMLTKYEKKYLSCIDYFILANRLARQNKYQSYGQVHILENFLSMQHVIPLDKIDKTYKFIYHGQLSYERGLIDLIEAFNTISKTHKNIMLTIIGSCRTEEFEKEFLDITATNNQINCIGQIPHNEIWKYLNDAHIGVIPFQDAMLCRYNTPTKLFEYMGTNCGIVSSDLAPIKEFCPDSASWAKPGDSNSLIDAMTYYIENIDAYNNHRNINNTLIRDIYNWEKISSNLLHIYKELLN